MADLEQQLAQLEQKTARLKDRIKRQDTAEKVVIGGMMLAYARKHPANAKRLLDIMHSELREQDLKRVDRAKNELSLIVGNSELANSSHYQGGYVNTPNLKQHQSRNIKPPVYTQQVSYHSMNHAVVHGYKH